ncbi:MAG: PDZ domain-containing protein [Gammaproteobacteria bacterium]
MRPLQLVVLAVLLHGTPGMVLSQSAPPDPEPPDPAQLEQARAKLEAARTELERAAQELARLSATQYASLAHGPYINAGMLRIGRPLLGLNIGNDDDGVRVVGVTPGGPGEAAGIEPGDLIVSIEAIEVDGSSAGNPIRRFFDVLSDVEAGSDVELGLLRDGASQTVIVETNESRLPAWFGAIGERVDHVVRDFPHVAERNFVRVMEQPYFFGAWSDMELVELTPGLGEYFGTDEGLLVVRAPESEDIDLLDGDVILQIGGRVPQSVGHAMRILRSFEPDEPLEITLMRNQRRQSVELTR